MNVRVSHSSELITNGSQGNNQGLLSPQGGFKAPYMLDMNKRMVIVSIDLLIALQTHPIKTNIRMDNNQNKAV